MITGEHAVVHGYPALVAAVAMRATVEVTRLQGRHVEISSAVGSLSTTLDRLSIEGPLRFLIAAIKALEPPHGLRIAVTSAIDPTLGLGSSAAVTVACLGALDRLIGRGIAVHPTALRIVREVQGRGSGADLAASFEGGMITYALDASPERMPLPPTLSLKYVGYKTPTQDVLAGVEAAWTDRDVEPLYARMGDASKAAILASRARDWSTVAAALDLYQGLMAELGVSNPDLDRLVCEGRKEAMAAKISGSGLGDCVLAFGGVPKGWERAKVDPRGLVFHD
ncbi:MAG: mevalonate kinase [Pseudomonadota bacterium]